MSEAALQHLDDHFDSYLQMLADLTRIPGISLNTFPAQEVRRSAEAFASLMPALGLEGARLLELENGHPAVFGEHRVSDSAPTLLIYGHHDVQPPGRVEHWESAPFEAEIRGGRIYGRGTSDDKGGILAQLAAIHSSIQTSSLPCNVKVLIEGEEEIGSPNLGTLLDKHRQLFECNYIVLCDTPNFAQGVPALTYRLRGNTIVDVEVRCLRQPLHSGRGGGVVPDAVLALCTLIARLYREDGGVAIPGLEERIHVDESQLAAIRALPFDLADFRNDTGLLPGVGTTGDEHLSHLERVWARPSLTVTAIEAVPMASAANQLIDVARARFSLRTVRDLSASEAGGLLARAVETDPPFGAQVTTNVLGGPAWWEADPRHPIFAAARRALTRGFGREAVMIGSGGSIGFVQPFAALAGEIPPLLTGVQDPSSNAHSENESLHLGDWRSAMRAAVYLFEELAGAGRP